MTRFYFDIRENGDVVVDEDGIELPSLEDARREATQALAEIAQEAIRKGERSVVVIDIRSGPGEKVLEAIASSSIVNLNRKGR